MRRTSLISGARVRPAEDGGEAQGRGAAKKRWNKILGSGWLRSGPCCPPWRACSPPPARDLPTELRQPLPVRPSSPQDRPSPSSRASALAASGVEAPGRSRMNGERIAPVGGRRSDVQAEGGKYYPSGAEGRIPHVSRQRVAHQRRDDATGPCGIVFDEVP